jgi:hypothetical protein
LGPGPASWSDVLARCRFGLFNDRGDGTWTHEHAKARIAFKVSLALNGTIVFARGFGQFDPDPVTGREMRGPNEPDGGLPSVGQSDHMAGREISHDRASTFKALCAQWVW